MLLASVKRCSIPDRLLLSQRAVVRVLASRAFTNTATLEVGYLNRWLDVQANNIATCNHAVFLERPRCNTWPLRQSQLVFQDSATTILDT